MNLKIGVIHFKLSFNSESIGMFLTLIYQTLWILFILA